MYHGGTNFGRTASEFVTSRYYDEAPLDEYGMQREPKWGDLKDLHAALQLCKKALLWGNPSTQKLGDQQEVRKSMCRLKHVLSERAIAEPDPRRSTETKRMINAL